MTCPDCHTDEIYKISYFQDWMLDDNGSIIYGDLIINYSLVHYGKSDIEEPGKYECVNGHEIEVKSEVEIC